MSKQGIRTTDQARFAKARQLIVSKRERWESMKAEAEHKYGKVYLSPYGVQAKIEDAMSRFDDARDRFYALLREISPRNWESGVPTWWIERDLTFEDAVRSLDEKLSVDPPRSWGS